MKAAGMGLLLEEHRSEIADRWRNAVGRELATQEPALAFAVAPLLREMALALRDEVPPVRLTRAPGDGFTRCAVLVRSSAQPPQLAREFKLLHREMWEVLRAHQRPVSQVERRAADEWLDEALASALDRLERVRLRVEAFERGPIVIPARPPPLPARPPPLPARPPPLPARPPPLPGSSQRASPARTDGAGPVADPVADET